MSNKMFWATSLIGGGDALDGIDGNNLTVGDGCIAILNDGSSDLYYHYRLQSSGAVESSPGIISPDSNPGTKRWHLVSINYELDVRGFSTLQAAFSAASTNGVLNIPAGTYIISTGLTTDVELIQGAGRDKTIIRYTGTGVGLTISGKTVLKDLTILTTQDAATAVMITDGARKNQFSNVYITGNFAATNIGKGLHINAVAAWVGGIDLSNVEIQGYKYGIYCQGTSTVNTMTGLTGTNVWLVGRSAGVISGSRGIYMDAWTNGIGSIINGGTIESFDVGIEVVEGNIGCGYGISYSGDFEGNNTNWNLGKSFNGIIFNQNTGNYFQQGTNALANKWFQNQHLNGEIINESHYSQKHVSYTGGSEEKEFSYYRGGSIIDGGSPFLVGGFFSKGSEGNPILNYLALGSHKMSWGSAAPTSGTWKQGDIIWNTAPASGGATLNGWRCDHSGTFSSATDNTGDTDGSTAVITGMTDTSDFSVGDYVDVSAGFASTGPYKIVALTATTITLDTVSNAVATNITVDTSDPTFVSMGVLP